MDITFLIPILTSWVVARFPSLGEYVQYVGPALMILISVIGIFTNLLPKPDHKFPVPDVKALEIELGDSGGFILKMAKFTRSFVIGLNWFIGTAVYSWFYRTTNVVSGWVSRFKKTPVSTPTKDK